MVVDGELQDAGRDDQLLPRVVVLRHEAVGGVGPHRARVGLAEAPVPVVLVVAVEGQQVAEVVVFADRQLGKESRGWWWWW